MSVTGGNEPETVWSPQPGPQEAAIRAVFADELFYGGAAGGGKSDFLLGDFLMDLEQGAAWRGVIFRQTHPSLEELVSRSMEFYPRLGGDYKVGSSQWFFPNGANLKFRHFETPSDFVRYQGHQYAFIGFDELPEWEPAADGGPSPCYTKMKSRLRGVAQNKRMRSTGNPGGVGHSWVQEYFRIPNDPITYLDAEPFKDEQGMTRLFIPSRLQDNRILMESDPDYINRLAGVGDPELVRAWLEGDWNAVIGAYFGSVWGNVELCDSFEIPESWSIFTGLDYGEASPTCWLMGAVDYDKNLWIINEYYEPDRSASEHAEAIVDRIAGFPYCQRRPTLNLADPSIFVRRRLTEAQNRSAGDIFREQGLFLKPGNNNRVNGWRVLRDAMAKGKLRIFKEWCPNLIRTLPRLPRDEKRPEDVNTDCFRGTEQFITPDGPVSFEEAEGTSGVALTRFGWKKYEWCRQKRCLSEVVEVTFGDGSRVVCTPNHQFHVEGRGWTQAADLQGQFCTTVRGGIPTSRGTTGTALDSRCTDEYGSANEAPYRPATKSTMWMATDTTTLSTTSSASPGQSTYLSTRHPTQTPASPAPLPTSKTLPSSALSAEWNSHADVLERPAPSSAAGSAAKSANTRNDRWRGFAQSAEIPSGRCPALAPERHAGTSAAGNYVVSVKLLTKPETTYCIHVPGVREFVLASGIVVHNSEDHAADALRYLAVHVFGPSKGIQRPNQTAAGKIIEDSLKEVHKGGRYS